MTRKRLFNVLFYGFAAVAVCAVIGGIAYMFQAGATSLPEGGPAPDFTAENLSGKPVSLSDLNGKIVVVTWYYTRCTDECPLTMLRFEQLQQKLKQEGKLGNDVVLVSLTLDPKHDTLPVIAKYAAHYHADLKSWYFLRATPAKTAQILKEYGIQDKQLPHKETIEHTIKTEVIDPDGNIRKTYNTANLNPNQMLSDINSLLARKNWVKSTTGV